MSKLIGEVQRIKAGGNFDGTTPTTDSDIDSGVKAFLPDSTGGLFDLLFDSEISLTDNVRVRRVENIRLKLDGNTTAWSVSITDGTTDTVILAGTNETNIVVTNLLLDVYPNQQLKIETTGATGALRAEIAYGIARNSL